MNIYTNGLNCFLYDPIYVYINYLLYAFCILFQSVYFDVDFYLFNHALLFYEDIKFVKKVMHKTHAFPLQSRSLQMNYGIVIFSHQFKMSWEGEINGCYMSNKGSRLNKYYVWIFNFILILFAFWFLFLLLIYFVNLLLFFM